VVVRAAASRPSEFAIRFIDLKIIDACFATAHQPVFIELPEFVTKRAVPLALFVVPFVNKPDRHPVDSEAPNFLHESVVQFSFPLTLKELDNMFLSSDEVGAVSPSAVGGVGKADPFGIFRIPRVFGEAGFLHRRLEGKWWQRWPFNVCHGSVAIRFKSVVKESQSGADPSKLTGVGSSTLQENKLSIGVFAISLTWFCSCLRATTRITSIACSFVLPAARNASRPASETWPRVSTSSIAN